MKDLTTSMSNNITNMQTRYHSKNNEHWILLYAFFWVIPRYLNFIRQRFGTFCLFRLHRRVGIPTHLWRWNRQSVEMLPYKIQTPGNYPEESIQHSEHGECLKSRIRYCLYFPSPLWHTDILLVSSRVLRPSNVCSLSTNSWVHNALHTFLIL